MWVPIYKFDEDNKLLKFKARLIVRGDKQQIDTAQDVYTATLAAKVFRALITLCAAGGLKTRQLDAILAFLDAYIAKLVKIYNIDITGRPPKTLLPLEELMAYDGENNPFYTHKYRQHMGAVSYPASTTRPDIARPASKLLEFLINLGPKHLDAVNYYL